MGVRRYADDTHCVNGHEYTEANTRIRPDGFRACRACHRAGVAAHKKRQRERRRTGAEPVERRG